LRLRAEGVIAGNADKFFDNDTERNMGRFLTGANYECLLLGAHNINSVVLEMLNQVFKI